MSKKVFILGRPGSGKSTAAQYIAELAKKNGSLVIAFNDYDILREMFEADSEHKLFRATANDGFDVLDFSTLETALHKLEERITKQNSTSQADLLLIEFARDDHCQALKAFSSAFLQNSYFLFINVDVQTCLERIHRRVSHRKTKNDHPSISDNLFKDYYGKEDARIFCSKFQKDYPQALRYMHIINNNGSRRKFSREIKRVTNAILENRNLTAAHCWRRLFSWTKPKKEVLEWSAAPRSHYPEVAPEVSMPLQAPVTTTRT